MTRLNVVDIHKPKVSPLYFPVRMYHPILNGVRDENNCAVCRIDDNGVPIQVYGYVTTAYKLVTHEELFTTVDLAVHELCKRMNCDDAEQLDYVSGYGKVGYREYRFPDLAERVDSHTTVTPRIIAGNGYCSDPMWGLAGLIDGFCTNGMVVGNMHKMRLKHTAHVDIDKMCTQLMGALQMAIEYTEQFKKWTCIQLTTVGAAYDFIDQLVDDGVVSKRVGQVWIQRHFTDLNQRGTTLFALYSTLTWWATHYEVKDPHKNDVQHAIRIKRMELINKVVKHPAWLKLEKAA